MIRIAVRRDAANRVVHLTACGHAGYAARGSDIVCSAISALVQTAILGVSKRGGRAGVDPEGRAEIVFSSEPGPEVAFLLDTVVEGLNEIMRQYPDCLELVQERAQQEEV